MQLLVMGRSVKESRDAPHRYRLCEQNFPPKFNSAKKQREVEATNLPIVCVSEAATPLKKCEPEHERPVSKPGNVPVNQPKRRKGLRFAWLKEVAQQGARFLSKSALKFTQHSSRAPAAIFSRPPLQEELSLDAVRVIRNDLSDADLEVVPVKERSSIAQPELKMPATTKQTEISAVGKVTARLLAALDL